MDSQRETWEVAGAALGLLSYRYPDKSISLSYAGDKATFRTTAVINGTSVELEASLEIFQHTPENVANIVIHTLTRMAAKAVLG